MQTAFMRKLIHRLLGGVPAGLASGLLAVGTLGGETVRVEIADAASRLYNDHQSRLYIFVVAVFWLIAWAISQENVWEWLKRKRRRPQLYLFLAPVGQRVDPWKTYFATWSPIS